MRLIDADKMLAELSKFVVCRLGEIKASDIKKFINNQPTVNDWIQCSEKLPPIPKENTKLKAEIERLNGKSEMYRDMADSFCNSNIKLKVEIEQWQSTNLKLVCELTRFECENIQLKSELEQLVKEKSEVISKIEYALNECEPIYNKCAVIPQAKPVYDLAMNYCLDLLKGETNGN